MLKALKEDVIFDKAGLKTSLEHTPDRVARQTAFDRVIEIGKQEHPDNPDLVTKFDVLKAIEDFSATKDFYEGQLDRDLADKSGAAFDTLVTTYIDATGDVNLFGTSAHIEHTILDTDLTNDTGHERPDPNAVNTAIANKKGPLATGFRFH